MKTAEEREEDERFWNLVCYKFYGTDKEMEEFFGSPRAWIIMLVIIVALIFFSALF